MKVVLASAKIVKIQLITTRRKDTIAAVLDYARYTMSPFVYDNEELENLCEEVRHSSEEYTYSPIPIRLKQRLTTLDLRHFVWNIGERLGTKNGYNGYARADFIKAMFPDVMKDIEQDSIRNFKFQPNKGSIVIDEPNKGDYHFHILPANQQLFPYESVGKQVIQYHRGMDGVCIHSP